MATTLEQIYWHFRNRVTGVMILMGYDYQDDDGVNVIHNKVRVEYVTRREDDSDVWANLESIYNTDKCKPLEDYYYDTHDLYDFSPYRAYVRIYTLTEFLFAMNFTLNYPMMPAPKTERFSAGRIKE